MPSSKLNAQEVDAYSDSGSTISLASCGSGGSGLTPKPPLDATSRSRSVKGRRSKVTQPPSPYASRQVTAKRHEAVNSTTRNLWLTSMKNGTGALSTNNTAMNTWAGPRPSYAKKRRPGSRTRNFSDVVEFSKTKSHSRSASLSNTEPHVFGGGPALKPAEDYYDEIIGLKKIINSLKEDNNLLSTKLHRVEEENIIKDRKMYDLLNSRKQPEDLRRTLTDKRGDTSAIVNSLKQKLHGVERTVKEKEAELSNLRRELKMTDIEELRIQSETYYQEVQRLQLAMLQMQQERINYTSSMTDLNISDELASARGKRPMSASQHRLLKDIEMLKAENKSLKKELISAVENQSKKSSRQSLNVDYADMSRAQLLHAIHELEMKLDEPRDRMKDSAREKDEKDEKKGSKKRKSQESEGKLGSLEETQAEMTEERDKLRQMIERLKEDRTHYRNVADDLRKQLKAKEEEVEDLHHRLSQTTPGTTDAGGPTTVSTVSGTVMRRKSSTTSTASQSSGRRKPVSARERDLQMEKEFEEFKQRHAAKVLQKQWRSYQGKKQDQLTKEQEKLQQEEAAKTLQREWKKHLKLKERASQDEVITDIQAAFRGHLARKDRLDRFHSDSMDSDDAIINVQSAMRGHLTRSRNREEPEDEWPGYKAPERINHEASDNADDDEDDIVIRRSSSYNKSPFSSKKRSKFTAYSASPSLSLPQPTPRTKSPPHPAPRTLKTPDSTPPSPAPRHKGRTAEVRPPESVSDNSVDSDDDNVVIGGSSLARKGLTKDINPQRTIAEVSEESDNQLVASSHKSPKKTNSFKTSKSSKSSDGKREKNIHEIIDSDDDDDYNADADDGLIVSHAKGRSSSTNYGKSSAGQTGTRDSWSKKKTQTSGKMRKTSSRDLDDSEEESDDNAVVVTSKKRTESKQKDIVSSRSSFQSRASSPKRASLVDSLLSPKRTLRTSEDIRTTGRGSINDDDDDDDDDDDIVVGSWRKRTTKEQTSPKKDSLSSLWSDSSKQKKKSSSGLGFGSFEKFSSSRKRNSGLDELF
ncbi:IQ domain-containing protein E-like isoform X3 [Actinia tenebrosa]|uniref:IQ domain-containing protein E-like isoform X3 n=1 Tax=Actinia tenebrosa TaxID=6105 RepID=A0A6P8IBG0_ACTTE|nr:IQ domain-containing protein E-like isoform X3 [Actinia tenebrosa]